MVLIWFLSGLGLWSRCRDVEMMNMGSSVPSVYLRTPQRLKPRTAQPELTVATNSSQRQSRANRKHSLIERMWLVRAFDESLRESPTLFCPLACHSEPPIFSPSL